MVKRSTCAVYTWEYVWKKKKGCERRWQSRIVVDDSIWINLIGISLTIYRIILHDFTCYSVKDLLLSVLSPFFCFILFGLPRWIFFLVVIVIRVGFVSIHFKDNVLTHFHTQSIRQRNGNDPIGAFKVKVDTSVCVIISGTFRKIEVPVFCSVAVSRCPWWRSLLWNWWLLYYSMIFPARFNTNPSTGPATG